MSTIKEILHEHDADNDQLEAALMKREDEIADALRLNGLQFGLYPEIVAEVLATIGIGTPPDEFARVMIRQQFETLMRRLHEEHQRRLREEGGD